MKKNSIQKGKWIALALAGMTAVTLGACGKPGNATGKHDPVGTYSGISATESVYAVGAVTTAKLLDTMSGGVASVSAILPEEAAPRTIDAGTPAEPATGTEQQPETQPEANPTEPATGGTDAQDPDYGLPEAGAPGVNEAQNAASEFNRYFNMLDDFLDKAATKTVVESNTSADPLLQDYAYKLTVTGKDIDGSDAVHTVYYSETAEAPVERTETDDGETTHVRIETYRLDGLVDMGTAEDGSVRYSYMAGTRVETTETEGRESETSSVLTMRSSLQEGDTRNYVEMIHESETEQDGRELEQESTYTYSVYAEGRLTERTQIEFESEEEHGEKEVEYSVSFLTGASRGTYEIERETKSGATWIAVEYTIDGTRGKFVIVQRADGTYDYKFSKSAADDRNFRDFDD